MYNQCYSLSSHGQSLLVYCAITILNISLFCIFFFFFARQKDSCHSRDFHAWRETTIVTLVNVKMKLYLASADLIAEQWEWQTQRKGMEQGMVEERGGRKGRVLFCCDRVPYLLIHSTTRNRETLGSCRSRIRESRSIVCTVCLYCILCMCVFMFICLQVFCASLFLPISRV